MRLLMILLAVAPLAGCEPDGWSMGTHFNNFARQCVDGVEYLQFTTGATVAYTRDGKVRQCGS